LVSKKNCWQDDALCASPRMEPFKDIFFSDDEDEIKNAKLACGACPVRKECLSLALENKEIWGVWGGVDENELRIVLSVDENGQEVRRIRKGEAPFCPNCRATTSSLRVAEKDVPGGGRWTTKKVVTCDSCSFSWASRASANAIEAFGNLKKRPSQQG
jgi:WhiB family transcriptional regulator, redox-sensing transcriptional regulator